MGLPRVHGADHGDGPNASNDASGNLNDIYAFLDPNSNSNIVVIVTLRGFIAAGENGNFGQFDHRILTMLEVYLGGALPAVADFIVTFQFSPQVSRTAPQTATITLMIGSMTRLYSFTAPTTISSIAATAPPQTVTSDAPTGIRFFAGMTDDPFFFDIPAFNRFTASVLAGTPDPSQLMRGRDSFAGYNTMAIALSVPRNLLPAGVTGIGVGARTFRASGTIGQPGFALGEQLDREGVPAVNVALTPFSAKNAYNVASPQQDAAGAFASGIVATLQALGTNQTNINFLASLAVTNGDLLRLNFGIPNMGSGGGNNPAAAFPNGRRLRDVRLVCAVPAPITRAHRTSIGRSVQPRPALPSVAGVFPQTRSSLRLRARASRSALAMEAQEVSHEARNVLGPLTEGRQRDANHVDPVEQFRFPDQRCRCSVIRSSVAAT
jgi:hypothetical protein